LLQPEKRDPNKSAVTQKAAEIFNTNRTYISEAQKLKEEKPEVFEQVKRGEKTITEVKKEAKVEKRKADIQAQKEEKNKSEMKTRKKKKQLRN
jgi:hypothetical protein